MPADDSTLVWIADTMVEAQIAEAALREAGIPCILENYAVNPYDGIWVPQKGWARIFVAQADLERARETIQEALASNPLGDDEKGEQDGGKIELGEAPGPKSPRT